MEVADENRKPAVLTFVIDVSGSMNRENRLGLVKRSLEMLIDKLRPQDKIGIAVYGSRGVKVLDHTGLKDITLKIRYGDFRTLTRSLTMGKPTNTTHILLQEATQVFNQWYKKSGGALRLLGFGTAGLSPEGTGQKLLFSDPEEEKQKKIDSAFDIIRKKHGEDSLKRGI